MGRLRDNVRERLDGWSERQRRRDLARATPRLLSLRRKGAILNYDAARDALRRLRIDWVEESVYGMSILATEVGITLPYRPDGTLDWSPRRHPGCGVGQLEMFPDVAATPEDSRLAG